MSKALISDELWSLIAAHLPVHPPSPKGGRPRIGDRATLTGILFGAPGMARSAVTGATRPAVVACRMTWR
jgi:transposase